ncbi:hypothetical protein Tcan_10075 [Toxocara canis]|uniref:DUF7802 domain-containing protein n=1 Tax=Toxocara canis TaxID=6265 RepID=A0A0B2VYZ7_TOXCA|nr:hypothetical protein Tcan_10075 [Toxocara canis]
MDYLLDAYFFKYLPFEVSETTRRSITSKAVEIIRVADWWCKAQDPRKLIASHPSFLAAELIFVLLCILTFCHAADAFVALNLRIINVGYLLCVKMNDSRMRLPLWAEGPAVGLLVVLISFPLQLMGVKLLWWQWHDSDPSMADRIYSIPWNMLFFDASVGCSFAWTLHLFRRFLLPHKYDWMLFVREFMCVVMAAVVGLSISAAHLAVILHPLHDILEIHSGVVTLILLATYAVVVIVADRHNVNGEARPRGEQRLWFDELACGVCIHYLFYMTLTMVVRPENVVAEGLHQPIGMCNVTEMIDTPWGMELERQKYICAYGHEGKYFDFHCLPGGKAPTHIWDEPLEWYIMCGTPFENRLEYIVVIWWWSILAMVLLYEIGARSGTTPDDPIKVYVKRSAERPKITTMERQDSEELKGMLDEELDLKKTEDTEEMAQAEADMKGERSRSRTRMGRSSSKGKLSPTSQIPMPTSAHELRSRKKKADS